MKNNLIQCVNSCSQTTAYAIIMLAVFPLFTGISGYMYLQLKKYLFFLVITIFWVSVLIINECFRLSRTHSFSRLTLTDICVLVFAATATISTWLSEYSVFFTREIGKYDSLIVYLLYCCILLGVSRHGLNLERCILAFSCGYTVCCGIAILQICGWNALWLFPNGMTYYSPFVKETSAFLGTMGNIDVFSSLHCLALPLLISAFPLFPSRCRWMLLLPVLMGSVTLVMSGVASGMLASSVTAILLFPYYYIVCYHPREKIPRWCRFSGATLLVLILLAAYFIPFSAGTAYELHQILHGCVEDSFGSHRILIWRETVSVFKEHYIFGIGPDSLVYYLDIVFERYSEALGETIYTYADNAHNAYLQVLVNFGILGCIPFSVLMSVTISAVKERLRDSLRIRALCPSLLCYLIQAFFNVGTCMLTPCFLILWGALLYEIRMTEGNTAK